MSCISYYSFLEVVISIFKKTIKITLLNTNLHFTKTVVSTLSRKEPITT